MVMRSAVTSKVSRWGHTRERRRHGFKQWLGRVNSGPFGVGVFIPNGNLRF
jgi:hypothetical protein